MEPALTHRVPDEAMRNPNAQGLRWALVSSLSSAALIAAAGQTRLPFFTANRDALLWGSLGIGAIGYLLGNDLARAENRTANIARTYERLERNGLLVPDALPAYNDRQRHDQKVWRESLKAAAIQGAGSAALAIGVEAALTPGLRPIAAPAGEWGPVGALQGAISGALQAQAHNRRAALIRDYEAKAQSFAIREEARPAQEEGRGL